MISYSHLEKHPLYNVKLVIERNQLRLTVTEIKEESQQTTTTKFLAPTKENPNPAPQQETKTELKKRMTTWAEQRILLTDLQGQPMWSEASIISFALEPSLQQLVGPLPALADALPARASLQNYYSKRGLPIVFSIVVPSKSANFDDCHYFVNLQSKGLLECNKPTTQQSALKTFQLAKPNLKISGPSTIKPGEVARLTVRATNPKGQSLPYPVSIYLEAVSGYLPHTRLDVVNGQGTFKVMALGLDAGDQGQLR